MLSSVYVYTNSFCAKDKAVSSLRHKGNVCNKRALLRYRVPYIATLRSPSATDTVAELRILVDGQIDTFLRVCNARQWMINWPVCVNHLKEAFTGQRSMRT